MTTSKELRPWLIFFGATVGVALLMLIGASMALASNSLSDRDEAQAFALCERATARWERITDVPRQLLQAISLAESGKWSDRDRRVRAWPWTVTSGGPGTYFPTREAALNEVRRLQAAGVENIDVGCMQVNLGFHGHNFKSIEHAIDPDINAAYAAKFLSRLHANAGSWGEAAGHYHSMTPERTEYYRGKVEKFWAGLRGEVPIETASNPGTEEAQRSYTIAPIDRARTAALNKRFARLTTAARKLRDELDPEIKRQRQLEAWRTARGRAEQLQALLAERRAQYEARRKEKLEQAFSTGRKERFKENRLRQLAEWRERVAAGN